MQEEEGAVSSECRLHVLWVQEPPAPPGGEALRGLRQLPWQWHPAPGLLAPGPPEEEEEEAQHHGPWKETEMTEELSPHRAHVLNTEGSARASYASLKTQQLDKEIQSPFSKLWIVSHKRKHGN